ncbi:MAG: leucine-rich repeat protein, partial [Clostridia bacterium]|nr:leucine-rich repeat protein [Clostridia bacterium]
MQKRRVFSLMIAVLMAMQCALTGSTAAVGNEISAEVKIGTYTYENPMFADDTDIPGTETMYASPAMPADSSGDGTWMSYMDDAVGIIRDAMIGRQAEIEVPVEIPEIPDDDTYDFGNETSAKQFLEDIQSRVFAHDGSPDGGDYLKYSCKRAEWGLKMEAAADGQGLVMTLFCNAVYNSTAEQEEKVNEEAAYLADGWNRTGMTSEYAKISAIYNFICDHVVYDHEHYGDETYRTQYSAYGALIDGTSVCQGYALLFYRLALELELDARIVTGWGKDENGDAEKHAWNIVHIDGTYYNLDATWDAVMYQHGMEYKYYLNAETFDADHIRNDEFLTGDFTGNYPMAEENYFNYVSESGELGSEIIPETPGYELEYLKDLIEDEEELAAAFGDGYPGSVQAGWPEAGSGTLLSGDVITGVVDGMYCWNNEGSNALKVFDGDLTTFFDPVDAHTDYWCGVDLGGTYKLTEIRIHPREEWASRLAGGAVQGSNDGENWTTVLSVNGVTSAPAEQNYHCFTPVYNSTYAEKYAELGYEDLDLSQYWMDHEGAYRYYRYVNLDGVHGDIAELELYGTAAEPVEEEGGNTVEWSLENGNLVLRGEGEVVYEDAGTLPWAEYKNSIQRIHTDYGITGIGDDMFGGYPLLHTVNIAGSVKSVGERAFEGCSSLMNLNLNLGNRSYGMNAFCATAVRWVGIPGSLSNYQWAFFGTPFLEGIEIVGDGQFFDTDDGALVSIDGGRFHHYPAGRRENSYTVPAGVEALSIHCIDKTNLEELKLPYTLNVVDAYAVTENNHLTKLVIPASVETLWEYAFAWNSSLSEVYFYGDYSEDFNETVFDGAAEDLIVYYPAGNETWDACTWETDGLYNLEPFDASVLGEGDIDGIHWEVTADGVLNFTGEGDIPDYWEFWDGNAPEWYGFHDTIHTINIGEGIVSIGGNALSCLNHVTEINLPDSLKRIRGFAFAECAVEELHIPADVEWIEDAICWGCQNLGGYRVDENNPWYNDEDGVLFNEAMIELIAYPLGRTDETYEIPSTVRSINHAAFENEQELTSVVLNEGLQFVRNSAFCGVPLTELVIPMTVKHIEGWAFNTGGSLTFAVFEGAFPDHFGEYVFYGNEENPSENMPGEFKITANKNMPGWDQFTEGVLNAENNPEYPLELIDEPIGNFGEGQFENGMTWYIDTDGTLYLNGNGAEEMPWFEGEGENEAPWKKYAGYITAIEISEGIIDVSDGAFADLYNAVSVKLPETMQWIHGGAFHNCGSLEEVYIPARVEHIEGNAFNWCSGVQRYIVDEANECYYSDEDGVLYGDGGSWLMFYPVGRTDITEYTVDGSVYSVNGGAFARSSLRAVTFNDGVAVIGHSAFAESGNLEEVLFGSTVASLDNDAFADCPSLVKATFEGPAPAGEIWNLFTEVPEEFKVYYPENAGWEIDENGMWWTNEEQCYPTEAYSVGNPVIYSGEFDGFAWTLTNAGVLTVSGEGELPQFHEDVDNGGFGGEAPWHHVRGLVRTAVVEDGITALGHRTFADMDFLQDLQLPGTLEKLYSGAVHNSALSELHLPASLKEIENGALDSLWTLNTVTADGCEAYQVVDGVLYNGDMTELVLYPCRMEDEDSEFTVPGTVSAIHPSAFKHTELESITLSDNLEYIGWWAFAHNHSLTEIHIPARVNYIASCAFRDCRNLKDAWFYGMAPTVENEIFNETHEEFTVHYPTNLSGWILNEEGMWQPDGNPPYNAEGHEVEVPEGAVEIGELIVDDAVTGGWSFEWDGTLTFWGSGPMPSWDWGYESPWYKYAPAVTRVVFAEENALTSIGRHTFRDCVSLTSVEIPGNIEII